MHVSEFRFELPENLIAAYPAENREESRLLVVERASGQWRHHKFSDLPSLLHQGDLLVLNNTRVIPARIFGAKTTGGEVEFLFLGEKEEGRWLALARGKNLKPDTMVRVDGVELRLIGREGDGWLVQTGNALPGLLYRAGELPLPPYIVQRRKALGASPQWVDDRGRYQTVFATQEGAIAAPTAGLHFTPELLAKVQDAGVKRAEITLHVGPGTFMPVRGDTPELHSMHSERVLLNRGTVNEIAHAKSHGGLVTAVGTTVVRALEGVHAKLGKLQAFEGDINCFILPGHTFKVVDRLVTNFHLPESTLLMLVAAFAGRELILDAYREAVREGYRFYSYGDAMLIT